MEKRKKKKLRFTFLPSCPVNQWPHEPTAETRLFAASFGMALGLPEVPEILIPLPFFLFLGLPLLSGSSAP